MEELVFNKGFYKGYLHEVLRYQRLHSVGRFPNKFGQNLDERGYLSLSSR